MIEIIMLTEDRFLAVVWKEAEVHAMCLTTNEAAAQSLAEYSLLQKSVPDEIYLYIEKLVGSL